MEWLNEIYAMISVCISSVNEIYALIQCVYLVSIPEPVQYHIYTLAVPFDLRSKSVIYMYIIYIYVYIYTYIYM